ncbi:MAG: cytochrome c oxidase assembly protein [Pseudomonadota bacterium]
MDKNTKTALSVFAIVFAMVGLSFASVPLYDLLCRVTGFGGTTQIAESAPTPDQILDRDMTVYFNADTDRNLDWQFRAEKSKIELKVGEQKLINFIAKNTSDKPIAGTAVYNVTPLKGGQFFFKTQCFCFESQILQPGEEMNMPVVFYIDPKIDEDRGMDDVGTMTLSYNFFKSESEELDEALEEFYNR